MQKDAYDVLFNGRWVASISYNEDWNWMQAAGIILPKDTIAPIGLKIESYYAGDTRLECILHQSG